MMDLRKRDFERILIIKPSSPGDIIHALPVLRGLRRRYPSAHLAWLVATPFANLLEADASLDEIILFDRKRFGRIGRSYGATLEFCTFVKGIRGRRFDLVIDLQGLFRSGFLAWAAGAKTRIGFRTAREFAWMFYNHKITVNDTDIHAADKNYLIADILAFNDAPRDFRIAITDEDRHRATALLREVGIPSSVPGCPIPSGDGGRNSTGAGCPIPSGGGGRNATDAQGAPSPPGVGDGTQSGLQPQQDQTTPRPPGETPYAVLVPATRWETKCWPPERFGRLARLIQDRHGLRSILVGGSSDFDIGQKSVEASRSPSDPTPAARNLCGKTTLRQLAALIDRAALVVTADSTPMHMAAAHERPLVALFGPTNPARTGPYGLLDDVERLSLDCSPCYIRKLSRCPHSHKCMQDLTVERVAEVVARRLSSIP